MRLPSLLPFLLLAACAGRSPGRDPARDSLAALPWPPTFEEYATVDTLAGPPAPLDLSDDPDARRFRIQLAGSSRADLAGHYAFVVWGCGTQCTSHMVLDLRTGRPYDDTLLDFSCERVESRATSALVVAHPVTAEGATPGCPPGRVRYFVWEGKVLRELLRPGALAFQVPEDAVLLPRDRADSHLVSRHERQLHHIDSLSSHTLADKLHVARFGDGTMAVVPDSEGWPETIESSFGIVRDPHGRVIRASHSPASRSGDWLITYTHYFDADGRTLAVERLASEFAGCVVRDTVATQVAETLTSAQERSRYFVAPEGRLLAKTFHRTDLEGRRDLTGATNCDTSHRLPWDRYESWLAMAVATGLDQFTAR